MRETDANTISMGDLQYLPCSTSGYDPEEMHSSITPSLSNHQRRRTQAAWSLACVAASAFTSFASPSDAFTCDPYGTSGMRIGSISHSYSTPQHNEYNPLHGLFRNRNKPMTSLLMVASRESRTEENKTAMYSEKLKIVPSEKNSYVRKEAIAYLLNDDDGEEDGYAPDDSTEAANQVADKKKFSKMSDEAKLKATMAIKRRPKLRASVKETGNDTMSHYLKSMGNHELLRKEDEVVLGRQIQILAKWEKIRQELEEELLRTPTFAEWADAVDTSVSELKKQIRRSQRAKAALIEANLRLVVTLARQSMKGGTEISFQDACQEGIIGLTKACEKFDPDKGFRFSTYANWWVKREVNENVADQSRTVKVPYAVVRKINKMKITEVAMRDELRRNPTDKELADKLDLSVEQLEFYRQKSQVAFSLDNQIAGKSGKGSNASGGGSSFTMGDIIKDPGLTPTEVASTQMLKDDVRRLIKTLSPREQAVIRLRFGLDDATPRTLDYIANIFNVPKEKIRKVEARALLKLKQPYRSNSVACYISDL